MELTLYHGTIEHYETPELSVRLSGLYTTTSLKVAKTYGDNIFVFKPKHNIKILDLSDGYSLINYMVKNDILSSEDLEDVDLENYILSGRLFQYDIQSKTHYMNWVVDQAQSDNYDLLKVPDDLNGYGDNIAYIILNMNSFHYYKNMISEIKTKFSRK